MVNKMPWQGLVIRTAAVRLPDAAYVFAFDLDKEKEDIPHAFVFRWTPSTVQKGDRNYNAQSVCLIQNPEPGYVDISEQGYYSITSRRGMVSGDIVDDSEPRAAKRRLGGFRSVTEIAGRAYAVGLRGMVYRLDTIKKWARLDEGLPDTFNIQAIHGFSDVDVYAVGRGGGMWSFDGNSWIRRDLPTNVNLTTVKCADDDVVYAAGYKGMLIRGRGDSWQIVEQDVIDDDIWDIEWFSNCLFLSTLQGVYRLDGNRLVEVDFGNDRPKSCGQLSVGPGVMWSIGAYDIMSFDGQKWTRI